MRILHVNFSQHGIGRYGLAYASALARAEGHDVVSVIHQELFDVPLLRRWADGARCVPLGFSGAASKTRSLVRIASLAREFKPDVIHDTSGSTCATGILAWPMLSRIAPLVITEHDPVPHSGMGTMMRQRIARRMLRVFGKKFVVHGQHSKETLSASGIDPQNILSTVHGEMGVFDDGSFRDTRREEQTILFFGALRPNKGVALLIPIAERVVAKFPRAKFLIAGPPPATGDLTSGSWPQTLNGILAAMQRTGHFEIHARFIADNEVQYFFRRAGVTILPYFDATQSGVLMIALPLGSPVVATNVGDIPEVVTHRKTGILCRVDAQDLADGICALLSDRELASTIAVHGKEFALNECSWDGVVRSTLSLYQSSLN